MFLCQHHKSTPFLVFVGSLYKSKKSVDFFIYPSPDTLFETVSGGKLLGGIEHYKECRTERVTFGERNGLSFGTGFSATYIATQNLGVRFMTDYDCAPPVVRGSRERLHKLSFGLGVSAVF